MEFNWLASSSPVVVWWAFLIAVSSANVALWLLLHRQSRKRRLDRFGGIFSIELMLLLSAAYVFGCAFRSALPRADVQRICLFDTWLSSVLVGRSVATAAEICFAAQWTLILRQLGGVVKSDTARIAANAVVPLTALAECCSWYAVVTTNYLGSAIEDSIWATAFGLIAVALHRLLHEFHGPVRFAIGTAIVGIAAYLAFLVTIDVPMYLSRWQADVASGRELLAPVAGLHDASTRWVVTLDYAHWKDEIAWMSLYFSAAVWSSLALCAVHLLRDHLPLYRARSRSDVASGWGLPRLQRAAGVDRLSARREEKETSSTNACL